MVFAMCGVGISPAFIHAPRNFQSHAKSSVKQTLPLYTTLLYSQHKSTALNKKSIFVNLHLVPFADVNID